MSNSGVDSPAASSGTRQPGAGTPSARAGYRTVTVNGVDAVLAVAAGVMVVLVHDVRYLLTMPYWLDEAWVADSLRAPLGLVPRLASSTPLGWTLLLRLVPAGGLERQRLVPLAFAGLAVAAGYLLGRELRLTRFVAGLLTAAAVLLSPVMLVRDDLKQYTAEAFVAIVIWLMVARLERSWTRWRLVTLALMTSVGTLFAETAIFTGGAAFTCLFLVALIRRQRRRLAELAVAGAGTLAIFGAIFEVVMKPRINSTLSVYWSPLYSPASPAGAARFFWRMLERLGPSAGFPAVSGGLGAGLAIPLVLAGAGIVVLALLRRYALAALLPVTLLIVMTGSVARQYPFGDQRTSTFWVVMVPVLMAIAVAGAIHAAGLGLRRLRPGTRWALPVVAVTAGAAAITAYTGAVRPDINSHLIAHEDARSQVAFAEAHFRPGDVMIANYGASYAFAYYYRDPATAYPYVPDNGAGFVPQYPPSSRVIVIPGGQHADVAAAMHQALADLAAEPPASRGRLWIIREHAYQPEIAQWQAYFTADTRAGGKVTLYHVSRLGYSPGFQPVVLYALPPSRPGIPKKAPAA